MSQIEGPNIIAGYDLETAGSLLGPIDYLPGETLSCIDRICNFIVQIWITIQRVFTYIFGDRFGRHLWYDNQAAFSIVHQYCTHSQYHVGTFEKINHLYQALRLRNAPSRDTSYADILGPQIAAFFTAPPNTEDGAPSHQDHQTENMPGSNIVPPNYSLEENIPTSAMLDPHFAVFFSDNAFTQFTPMPADVEAPSSNSVPLYIPVLSQATRGGIHQFIDRFLHQFITKKIDKNNAPDHLPGVSQILYDQIHANEHFQNVIFQHVQEIAFNEYIDRAIQGLYVYHKIRENIDSTNS